jgi:hypothetical protein
MAAVAAALPVARERRLHDITLSARQILRGVFNAQCGLACTRRTKNGSRLAEMCDRSGQPPVAEKERCSARGMQRMLEDEVLGILN